MTTTMDQRETKPADAAGLDYDVVIVGAGFAGMYQLHSLRQQGLTAHVYEAGDDVGWFGENSQAGVAQRPGDGGRHGGPAAGGVGGLGGVPDGVPGPEQPGRGHGAEQDPDGPPAGHGVTSR